MNIDQPIFSATESRAGGNHVRAVVGLLVLVELTSGFIQGGTVPLIPGMRDMLEVGTAQAQWITAVQFLGAAVCVPIFGRLGDLHGHRRMVRVALVSVTVGAIVIALAPTLPILLAGRVLQGPLAALLPLEIGLCRDRLDPEANRRAVGLLVSALALGSLLGSALSGPIYHGFGGIRPVLWVLAALAGACLAVVCTAVPESRIRAAGTMDWPGAVLLSVPLVLALVVIAKGGSWGWFSMPALGATAAVPVLLAVWVRLELRRVDPLVDVRAATSRAVAPHMLSAFIFGTAMLAAPVVAIAYLDARPERTGYGFGLSAWELGVCGGIPHLLAFVSATGAAAVAARIGMRRMLFLAFSLIAIGYAGVIAAHASLPLFLLCYSVTGTGIGLALAGLPAVIVESSSADRSAGTVAVYNNIKTLGGSIAGAAFAAILGAMVVSGTAAPTLTAYLLVWGLCTTGAVIAAALTLVAPPDR
ncbi:MFS transporter [Nocardia sp. NEAU-G5]|uniref:MFS transporter n=1 Tax=Nocardia albiluteola TaxID=2842303 RepID=A0ABS6AZV6_9NOCA|nr:MFS transporter [Nocardia albiluteola]MBU3063045.1 MFS transporter [Nocardia albiluteola]